VNNNNFGYPATVPEGRDKIMNYDSSGVLNGIEWSIKYLGGRDFLLNVGDRNEAYTCTYPMIFGIDVGDVDGINRKLDEMQEEVEKEALEG
jgi:hypothetical protein